VTVELRFDDKVAVVTGAGRGLGRSHAKLLASRGARLVVNDLGSEIDGRGSDDTPAREVVDEIQQSGGVAVADSNDVSQGEGAAALVERAVDAYGRLDIVVNNAGILDMTEFPEADLAQLMRHVAVHLAGTFNVCRSAWPYLRSSDWGRVVNTTSTAVLGSFDLIAYGAAKGGILGLSRALADSGRRDGINVNMISPMASTRMSDPSLQPDSRHDESRRDRPPELVAAVVAFLAHKSCSVTGEIFVAGRGRVSRLFLGQSAGYTNSHLTPEDVRDHLEAICNETGYTVPSGTIQHGIDFDAEIDTAIER
jgi:NAD(P)-dependent dehydrogenase (short-subunit alcohol dehydrogenase family)